MSKLLAFGLLLMISFNSDAQSDNTKKTKMTLKESIDSKKFRFVAISARTSKGRTVQLNGEYAMIINQDSMRIDLPYYGQSYTSTYGTSDLSVRFTSVDFSYKADTVKKGGWDITIVPKNQSNASKIFLSISESGYGNLNVTSTNRQAISYYGTLEGSKK